jgi:hypothetical protein
MVKHQKKAAVDKTAPVLSEKEAYYIGRTRTHNKKRKTWAGRKKPKNHIDLNPTSDFTYEVVFAKKHEVTPPTKEELLRKEHLDYLRDFQKSIKNGKRKRQDEGDDHQLKDAFLYELESEEEEEVDLHDKGCDADSANEDEKQEVIDFIDQLEEKTETISKNKFIFHCFDCGKSYRIGVKHNCRPLTAPNAENLAFFKHEPTKKKLTPQEKHKQTLQELCDVPFDDERAEQLVQIDLLEQIITEEDRTAICSCGKNVAGEALAFREFGIMCAACEKKRFGEKESVSGTQSVLKQWRAELVKQKKSCGILLK